MPVPMILGNTDLGLVSLGHGLVFAAACDPWQSCHQVVVFLVKLASSGGPTQYMLETIHSRIFLLFFCEVL